MKYLLRKMRRDMRSLKSQCVAVLIICFLSITIYAGIEGVWYGMQQQVQEFYETTELADYWVVVDGNTVSQEQLPEIKELPEVSELGQSTELSATLPDYDASIQFIAYKNNNISMPYSVAGKPYDGASTSEGTDVPYDIWLDAEFATIHNIAVGDVLATSIGEDVQVAGIIHSPERVYSVNSSSIIPDHSTHTYGYVSACAMEQLTESGAYDTIVLQVADTTDELLLKNTLQSILGVSFRYCYGRSELNSFVALDNKIAQIKKMSIMFSALFFFLVILIIHTTMKRIVSNQRVQIGTLQALGYGSGQIRLHYMLYGLLISIVGAALGLYVAPLVVSPVLMELQKEFFSLPQWEIEVSFVSYLLAAGLVVLCAGTAALACGKVIHEHPAQLLRSEPPKGGKQILLERFAGFWQNLSFPWKWSLRDIARYKGRTAIGVIGVLGSITLLIASFGIQDTVVQSNTQVYGEQYSYYEKFSFSRPLSSAEVTEIDSLLFGDVQWTMDSAVSVKTDTQSKMVPLVVYDSGYYLHLQDTYEQGGVVVASEVAKQLDVQEGNLVKLVWQGASYGVHIDKIIDISTPQALYISKNKWQEVGLLYTPNTLMAGNAYHLTEVREHPLVQESVLIDTQLEEANDALKSVQGIILLLICAAVLLSVVILYNLGVLSFTERKREYATLRVLGLYNPEIKQLIFKDTLVNLVIGIGVGIPAGLLFLRMYAMAISTTTFVYSAYVTWLSVLVAVVIAAGCSLVVSLIVSRKTAHINMIESLKSVE